MVRVSILTISIIISVACTAQRYTDEMMELDSFFLQLPSTIYDLDVISTPQPHIFSNDFPSNGVDKSTLWDIKSQELQRDHKITFNASGRWSTSPFDDFEDNTSQAISMARVGIKWDLLKDGYIYKNRDKAHLDNTRAIDSMTDMSNRQKELYGIRYQHIIYMYNKTLIAEYKRHVELLEAQLHIFYQLYYNRLIYYGEILELKRRLATLHTQLKQVNDFNRSYPYVDSSAPALSIYHIDLQKVLTHLGLNPSKEKVLAKEFENKRIEQDNRNASSLSVRAELQSISRKGDISFTPTLGFQVSIPLFMETNTLLDAEYDIAKEEMIRGVDARAKEIRIIHYEYTYKVKQYIDLTYQMEQKKEAMLTASFSNKYVAQNNTPIHSIRIFNDIMDLKRERIDVIRQAQLKALQLFTLAEIYDEDLITSLCQPIPEKVEDKIYIAVEWDSQKELKKAAFFINYLKRKRIKKVVIKEGDEGKYLLIENMLSAEGFDIVGDEKYTRLSATAYLSLHTLPNSFFEKNDHLLIDDIHKIIAQEKKNIGYEEF